MSLQHWALLWKVILIGGISLFAILALGVSFFGFFDFRRLFRTLRQTHDKLGDAPGSADPH